MHQYHLVALSLETASASLLGDFVQIPQGIEPEENVIYSKTVEP